MKYHLAPFVRYRSMNIKNEVIGVSFAILSAVIYGCQPLLTKLLYAEEMTALSIVLFRNIIAFPLLLVYCSINKMNLFSKKQLFLAVLAGFLGSCLTPIFLFSSYNYIPSGATTTIHYLYPTIVFLIAAVVYKVRLNLVRIMCLILSTTGVVLLYWGNTALDFTGLSFAFLSAITFAIYTTILGRTSLREMNPFLLSLFCCGSSIIVLLPVSLLSGEFIPPRSLNGYIILFINAILVSVFALLMFKQATKYIGGERSSVMSTFEPVTSIVIGVLLFHERLTVSILIGMLVILLSVVVLSFENKIIALNRTKHGHCKTK